MAAGVSLDGVLEKRIYRLCSGKNQPEEEISL